MQNINSTTYGLKTPHPHGDIEVEIGDVKQEKFFPRMKIKKWDNEVNFSVGIIDDNPEDGQIEQTEDLIKWKKGTIEAHFYPREDLYADDDKRGYEFEILLKEKPQSNVINLSIQTKGLDFFYQPALTSEEKLKGESRPENVEGSYAVYHKIQSGDQRALGGKHYAAGKAFHIYRPVAHDSNGKQVYCDLKIDEEDKLLSVIIPQAFLDTAIYPLIVDPTFGYTSVGATQHTSLINQMRSDGNSHSPGQAGTGTSMSIYATGNTSGTKVQLAIYNASTNALVGNTGDISIPNGVTNWQTGNFISNPSLSNINYLNVFNQNVSVNDPVFYSDDTGGTNTETETQTYGSWPSTASWTAGGIVRNYSIYTTYTASGVVPTIPVYSTGISQQPNIGYNIII